DDGVGLFIDVHEIVDARGRHPVRGRVQAFVAGERASSARRAWTAGRPVRAWIALRSARENRNPGAPSSRLQALRRSHAATGSIKSALRVDVGTGAPWHEAAAAIRAQVRGTVARFVAPHDDQSAAVVTAILIGDRAGLDPAVARRLQVAGTYHVIAISGGNVALITALCFGAFSLLLRSRRAVSVLTLLAVVWYGWLVGDDPSVTRAVTAAALVLAVHAFRVAPQPLHLLAAVALLAALVRPAMVVDVGAWLSFGATLGIVVGASRMVRWAVRPAPPGAGPSVRLARWRIVRPAAALLAATIAAELVIMPVQAAVFSRVGLAGLGLNFVAIPAMAAVQMAGIATVVLSMLSETAAAVAGAAAHLAVAMLLGSAAVVDYAPWVSWRVPPTPLWWSALYYACLACAVHPAWSRPRRLAAGASAGVLATAIMTAPGLERASPGPGTLRVSMLDVGQAEAIVVQFPDRHTLLVDAGGSAGSFDVGGRIVTPAVWALGARRLDWLLVTHPDLDHVGGAPAVVGDLAPREIWEGVAVPTSAPREALVAAARRARAVWRTVRKGHALEIGGVRLDVLHPPEPDWERRAVRNDDSVVLRISFGSVEVLLSGDAGMEFESAFDPDRPARVATILKAGHHGSRSSSGDAFLSRVAPDIALVSAGAANSFGHPHPEVIARLGQARAEVFRTDRDGAITIETDGARVDVRTWTGRRWRLVLEAGWPGPS
ncbi:MAG TPA: DNA internalization-related competence protein ComEC/Rec2, partial [Vicinamibacterales bacterium]|nr:DNA internalization-related competence protein ComEC/Rec2 [Vicinamibacterales bacterium]